MLVPFVASWWQLYSSRLSPVAPDAALRSGGLSCSACRARIATWVLFVLNFRVPIHLNIKLIETIPGRLYSPIPGEERRLDSPPNPSNSQHVSFAIGGCIAGPRRSDARPRSRRFANPVAQLRRCVPRLCTLRIISPVCWPSIVMVAELQDLTSTVVPLAMARSPCLTSVPARSAGRFTQTRLRELSKR